MLRYLVCLLFVFGIPAGWAQQDPGDEPVAVQFPNNPVNDIAQFYEALTGKRLIRDANLAGPNLSISVPKEIPRRDAVALIEAALLLNNYTLVPVDEHTSKLLGPSKMARSEGVPLYTDPSQLPKDDQVVSYFMPFHYLNNEEAAQIFQQYVAVRPFGSIVQVPNVNALVVTENVPLVRRLIALKDVIDVEGTRVVTRLFPLERADAEKVSEILKTLFEGEKQSNTPVAGQPPPEEGSGVPAGSGLVSGKPVQIEVIPDLRTNRVVVLAPENKMPYIAQLIADLDVSVDFEEPLERSLKFATATEVLPVLSNLLSEGDQEVEKSDSTDANAAGGGSAGSSGGSSGGGGGSGGVASKPDLLQDPNITTAPVSVVVGKVRIIADPISNKIIVIGPPEARSKAASVIEMLDQRPKQIYLAVVIGQLRLGDGFEAGVDYFVHLDNFRLLAGGTTETAQRLLTASTANRGVDLVPGASSVVNSLTGTTTGTTTDTTTAATSQLASTLLPALGGLTVFGSIADSVDVIGRALATDNRFQVISRPVVYTLNNKRAVISSGRQVPVPGTTLTSAVSSNSINNLGSSIASTIEYKDVVLKLEVIPLVNSNDEVTLKIAQQNDSILGNTTISDNTVPIIATQELRTTVTVPNRNTVILGGLITDEETRDQSGIPLLKDIPLLGYLFGSTTKAVNRQELIVMIQPFIVDSDNDLKNVEYIERSNMTIRDGLYDDTLPVKRATLPDSL